MAPKKKKAMEAKKFFTRWPDGNLNLVEGIPFEIEFLPGWKFFSWGWGGAEDWGVAEVRSGCRFPFVVSGKTPEEAEAMARWFCCKHGQEACERVFMIPISKFGELPPVLE